MTEIKKKKRKVTRRSKAKYPALQKKYNLKMRQDYIEADYVNGVYDKDGNMVMRPLNSEEKKFLNDYYEEVINANFKHDEELKDINDEIKELKKIKDPSMDDIKRIDYLQLLYFQKADDVLLYNCETEQRKIYNENNARNRCLYTRIKSSGKLDELNQDNYQELHEYVYSCYQQGENELIEQICACDIKNKN